MSAEEPKKGEIKLIWTDVEYHIEIDGKMQTRAPMERLAAITQVINDTKNNLLKIGYTEVTINQELRKIKTADTGKEWVKPKE